MKRISLIIATSICFAFCNQASAGQGGFVGIDGLWSHSQHKWRILNFGPTNDVIEGGIWDPSEDGTSTTGEGLGAGVNTGFRVDVNNFYLAPELFFDYLNNTSTDTFASTLPGRTNDSLVLRYRYGGRMNVGINIYGGMNFFVNAGVANINYNDNWAIYNLSRSGNEIAPVFGAGLMYDINYNVSFKLAYDYMSFNKKYVVNSVRDDVVLQTVRFGVVFGF